MENRPLLAADVTHVLDDVTTFNIGLETTLVKHIDLRLGYVLGRESQSITGGFGLTYDVFNIAYAFVPYSYDLGNSHRFSLMVDF